MISRVFQLSKITVRWHYKQYIQQAMPHRSNERPPILSAEEHEDLVSDICEAYTGNWQWTMAEILLHIIDRYTKMIDANSLRQMLDGDSRLKPCKGIP
jgi:hypothetical protein